MTEEDIRHAIMECVKQYGPKKAREILYSRLATDPQFMAAAAKHGFALLQAIQEADQATLH